MSDFKETCIWMSYRYAIGRKTIAANMHAIDISRNMDWIPENNWEFTGIDILREINDDIKFHNNISIVSYGDPTVDVFSVVFEWFLNNPQKNNIDFFMAHKWYIDVVNKQITNIEVLPESKIPSKIDGMYFLENLFSNYNDYKNWIKLANMFLRNYKYVTYEFDGRTSTEKCIEYYELDNKNKITKRYTKCSEGFSNFYINPEFIKTVSDCLDD